MFKRLLTLIILACSLASLPIYAQFVHITDFKIKKADDFSLNDIAKIDLRTLHAEMTLQSWQHDSIRVETLVEILSDKPNLSKEMLEEIEVESKRYADTLNVFTTLIPDFSRTIPYKITYKVYYPKHLDVNIANKHGIVTVDSVSGRISANLEYCKFSFNEVKNADSLAFSKINLQYCEGTINNIGRVYLNSKNSQLNISKADIINAKLEYNTFKIDEIDALTTTSNFDYFTAKSIKTINLFGKNSIVDISYLHNKALIECDGGRLSIKNTSNKLAELTVSNNNAPAIIHVDNSLAYTINCEVTNSSFAHPHKDKLSVITDQTTISVKGDIGATNNSNAKFIIFNNEAKVEFY